MAGYEHWNRAIVEYFFAGVAKGAPVFLTLDEEALEDIAERFLDDDVEEAPRDDFLAAVRERCILPFGSVSLRLFKLNEGDIPRGVGFLSTMVLAAYEMHEEDGIDESNYFLRLRELLDLPVGRGRPDGLSAGAEEPLWLAWNDHLQANGYEPTAKRGAGPQTYLRYAISQAILRGTDKDYLRTQFDRENLPMTFDCGQLGFWLTRLNTTRRHLREGLYHSDQNRVWEFFQAAHRVYESGDWTVTGSDRTRGGTAKRRSVECGLYRGETLLGDAEYYAFPKQPHRTRSQVLHVMNPQDDSARRLVPLRAGFFRPVWVQAPFLDEALECEVTGDTHIRMLLVPRKDFWVLTVDPDNPQGAWGTWRPFLELGEQLLILCRLGLFDDEMQRLRESQLIDWEDRIETDEWTEYRGCMVLSYDWGGFISTPECRSLADALSPRAMAGLTVKGGLRDPNQNAWLEGFPPTLKVYGFERQFEVIVTTGDGERVFQEEVAQQHETPLPASLEPGSYQVELKWGAKRVAMRVLRIISWGSIQERPELQPVTNESVIATAGLRMRGALIEPDDEEDKEVPCA